jgi:hypothetical protein
MHSLIGRYLKKRFCYPMSVFLTTACNTSSCFMSTPRCFPFRDILFVLNFVHLPQSPIQSCRSLQALYLCKRLNSSPKTRAHVTNDHVTIFYVDIQKLAFDSP